MREYPILMNGPMVRAILAGAKTQTRRVAKGVVAVHSRTGEALAAIDSAGPRVHCPCGQPGDRLWVRETTVDVEKHGYLGPVYMESEDGYATLQGGLAPAPDDVTEVEPHEITLRPSVRMPRSMCRILLEITSVRVERLQAISDDDALAEGVDRTNTSISGYARERFQRLWDSTGGDWDSNPWVWVIEFKRVEVAGG